MKRNLLIVLLIIGVLANSGCSLFRDEEKSFVDASIEASCFLSTLDPEQLNEDFSADMNKIYKKHGFPSDDQVALSQIMDKYRTNTEVQAEIQSRTEECRKVFLEKIMSGQGMKVEDVVIEEEVDLIEPEIVVEDVELVAPEVVVEDVELVAPEVVVEEIVQ